MKLQTKLTITILAVFIISISFIGILLFSNYKTNLESQIENQLQSLSQTTEKGIETFLEGQKNKVELIANQKELSNEELIQMIEEDDSFYDMFVINSSGIVITSSNPERIGLDRANRTYFTKARNQTYISPVYFALVPQEYSTAFSTPFHGGVLVGSTKISYLDKLVSDRTGLGKTGETLLGFNNENKEVVYFTKRLFSDKQLEIIPKEEAKELPIYKAINGEEKILINIKNYRNSNVLAFTNYIEAIGIGMVTMIDTQEAFAAIDSIQKVTILLIIIIAVLMIFVIFIIIAPISNEIKNISSDIDKITRGDLDIQLKKSNLFEIQNLVNSLNRILASMKLAILRTGLNKGELGIGELEKAKENAEEKYKKIYESSNDAIMVLEPPTWNFTAGNPATIRIFSAKDEKEFISKGPGELSPKKQPDGQLSSIKAKKMIEKAMKDGRNSFEWIHKRINGEEFLANVQLSKIKEGEKEYLQATVKEIESKGKKK